MSPSMNVVSLRSWACFGTTDGKAQRHSGSGAGQAPQDDEPKNSKVKPMSHKVASWERTRLA